MKSIAQGGTVRALVALGLVSYQAAPTLAGGETANAGAQVQRASQLIVKERNGVNDTLQLQSAEPDERTMRVDVVTVQRWSVAAQLSVTYKHATSGGAHVVTLPNTTTLDDAQAVAQRMAATGQFEYVASDRILRPAFIPSATWSSPQQNPMVTNATITTVPNSSGSLQPASGTAAGGTNLTTAWDTTTGPDTVNAAIVDTGTLSHADLMGVKINTGSDLVTNTFRNNSGDSIGTDPGDAITVTDITSNPTVCNGATSPNSSWYSTFVTGPVAAQHSGTRVVGIVPGVGVQMARALGRCGGAESDIIDAVTWANGGIVVRISPSTNPTSAKVINMSLDGTGSCDVLMRTATTNARNRGVVTVVAIDNESASVIDSSINRMGTIAVAAHTLEGDKATYASVGTDTTLSAPGSDNGSVVNGLGALIASLSSTGTISAGFSGYSGEAGASMVTPHVADVAVLVLSVNSVLTPDQTATILRQSAHPFPTGTYCATHTGVCGAGMLDAGAAAALAKGNPTVHAPTSASMAAINNATTLTTTGSAGFVNTIMSVQWVQISGSSVSLMTAGPDNNGNYTATFMPSTAGTYAFDVMLTSNTGVTATDTTNVTVTTAASTGATTLSVATSSSGGDGGAIGLAGAVLLLAAGLAGCRRRVK